MLGKSNNSTRDSSGIVVPSLHQQKADEHTRDIKVQLRVGRLDIELADLYSQRGRLYDNHLDEPQKAVADYTAAIKLFLKEIKHNRTRELTKLEKRSLDRCETQEDRQESETYTRNPMGPYISLAAAYYRRGMLYGDRLGEPEKAVADYTRALKPRPTLKNSALYPGVVNEVKIRRGKLHQDRLNQPEKALADFEAVLNRKSSFVDEETVKDLLARVERIKGRQPEQEASPPATGHRAQVQNRRLSSGGLGLL